MRLFEDVRIKLCFDLFGVCPFLLFFVSKENIFLVESCFQKLFGKRMDMSAFRPQVREYDPMVCDFIIRSRGALGPELPLLAGDAQRNRSAPARPERAMQVSQLSKPCIAPKKGSLSKPSIGLNKHPYTSLIHVEKRSPDRP